MITSIRLVNFKNFADETLRVGPFTVVVGANASGKSNIRDAFRFLHGIGRGYTLAEIINGKYGADWQPIRGATNEVIRFGKEMFSMEVTMNLETPRVEERFKIQVGVVGNERGRFRFQVTAEDLRVAGQRVYEPLSYPFRPVDPAYLQFQPFVTKEIEGGQSSLEPFRARRDQPALTQMRENNGISQAFKFVPKQVSDIFANIRFLELSPDRMREPGFPGPTMLGESGENLSVVLDD